jgi:hypothetical protein
MKVETKPVVAVQQHSNSAKGISLSAHDRKVIEDEFANDFTVRWLPPIVCETRGDNYQIETVFLLFVLGMSFKWVVKPFVEEVPKAAGKDFWTTVKTLATKLWSHQEKEAYALL